MWTIIFSSMDFTTKHILWISYTVYFSTAVNLCVTPGQVHTCIHTFLGTVRESRCGVNFP